MSVESAEREKRKRKPRTYEVTEKSERLRKYSRRLARNLDYLRKLRWLTQESVSLGTGIAQQRLSELESGWANPSLFLLIKLAEFHRVKVTDLFVQNPEVLWARRRR